MDLRQMQEKIMDKVSEKSARNCIRNLKNNKLVFTEK